MHHFKKQRTANLARKINLTMKHRTKIICIFLLFLINSVNASDYYTVMKTNTLVIRSGPGENYPIVGTLSLGDTVFIDEIYTPWCQIKENNKIKGYANGWYLKKVDSSVNSDNSGEKNQSYKWLLIGGGFISFLLILAFLFKRSALKNYGSIIALLATIFYYVFGFFLNMIFISMYNSSAFAAGFMISIFTYVLAIVVAILSIIGFFKNVGVGIIVLAAIISFIDFSTGAIPGAIMALIALFGGILITIGYSQLKQSA